MEHALSRRQILLAEYLVQKIGFSIDDFSKTFIQEFVQYSHFDEFLMDKYGDGRVYKNMVIEKLFKEIEIKEKWIDHAKSNISNYINATDIENYTFCPVAYSIVKSFQVPQTEEAKEGQTLHEREILNPSFRKLSNNYGLGKCFFWEGLDLTGGANQKYVSQGDVSILSQYFNYSHKEIYTELQQSELIFPFESIEETKQKLFYSNKGRFVGRPDYIFKNKVSGSYFVVEEKFRYSDDYSNPNDGFYENHANQLRAYLYCIDEFPISYGYLVYWDYKYEFGQPSVHNAKVKKIIKSEKERSKLENVYRSIQNLQKQKKEEFQDRFRHPKKCAKCGTSIFCGHKTGKHNYYTLPYSSEHLKIETVPYPEELRKSSKTDIIHINGNQYSLLPKLFKQYFNQIDKALGTLLIDTKKFPRYEANWSFNNEMVMLTGIKIFETGNSRKMPEIIYESSDLAIQCNFISGSFRCFSKTEIEGSSEPSFSEIRMVIKQGILIKTEKVS